MKSVELIASAAASDFRWIVFGAISVVAHAVVLSFLLIPQVLSSADPGLRGGLPALLLLATAPSRSAYLPKLAAADVRLEAGQGEAFAPDFPAHNSVAIGIAGEYLYASQLDQRPKPLKFFDFANVNLPDDLMGTVIVQLWIDESGHVDLIEIEHSTLGDGFAQELVKQRRSLLFQPGELAGASTRSIVRYEFNVAPAILRPGNPKSLGTHA